MTLHKSVLDCLKYGIKFLDTAGVPESQNSVEMMLAYILKKQNFELYLEELEMNESQLKQFDSLLSKRAKRYPLQYLIQNVAFRNVELEIGEGCLIPRPETEILIDVVLSKLPKTRLNLLDVGTGSGNIAISLAKENPNWQITATDISKEALGIAQKNAILNSVETRIQFIQTDLWNGIQNKFDVLISNPPYLTTEECEHLQPEITFEPKQALEAGPDGLAFFNRIIQNAHTVLKPKGFIFFEIGLGQVNAVSKLLKANEFTQIELHKDHSNIERIISAQLR